MSWFCTPTPNYRGQTSRSDPDSLASWPTWAQALFRTPTPPYWPAPAPTSAKREPINGAPPDSR